MELAQVLNQPEEIRGLLREIGSSFLPLAPIVYEPGIETVLKYSYSQPLPWKFSWPEPRGRSSALVDYLSESSSP